MINPIKDFFSPNSDTTNTDSQPTVNGATLDTIDEVRKRTYHEAGYRDSTRNSGSHMPLSICLQAVYAKFQNEEKEDLEKQKVAKEPYEKEQREKETELKTLEVKHVGKQEEVVKVDDKIKTVKDGIETIKFEINDLAKDPEKYHIKAKKGATAKFWIGLLLLLPISLYLFTFYVSTSYSAFFKKFDAADTAIASVFDPNAFEKAWNDGKLEGWFVTLIPFVFLGLGYLIHMFGENKTWVNYLKMVGLFLTTFVFDAILAYLIEYKIYEINKELGTDKFGLSIAFTKPQFWVIIFAGFVVYIIWGIVFDFVMKEHREKDTIKHEQQKRRKDIRIHQDRIKDLEKQRDGLTGEQNEIKESIAKVQIRIAHLQKIIDGVVIPSKEYVLYASEYMQGWITYVFEKLYISRTEKHNVAEECRTTYYSHLEEVGAKADYQNSIYLPEL